MISQVTFRAEEDVKIMALQRAKKDGITLRAILNSCLRAYAGGKIDLDLSTVAQKPKALKMHPEDLGIFKKRQAEHVTGKNVVSWKEARKRLLSPTTLAL